MTFEMFLSIAGAISLAHSFMRLLDRLEGNHA